MKSKDPKTVFRIPWRHRIKRWALRLPPLLVWGGALCAVVFLYLRQEQLGTIQGYAAEMRYSVAPEVPGRLKRLDVALHQEVEQDQIVCSLDDAALLLELDECRAELERLGAELDRQDALRLAEAAEYQRDSYTEVRRFARDVENTRIDYLEGLADLAEDRILLQGLDLTLDRSLALNDSELAPRSSLDEDRVAREALQEKITGQESRMQNLHDRWQSAQDRYAGFLQEAADLVEPMETLLKPFQYALRVQETRIEQVNLAMTRLVLRAPATGRVARINKRTGEVLLQGEEVLAILEPCSREVVGYVAEEQVLQLEPGTPVTLRRKAAPGVLITGTIAHVGEAIEQLPLRLNPLATMPRWGLAFSILLPDSLRVKPGEAFHIVLGPSDRSNPTGNN